jgi:hypothetical protein
MGVLRSPQYQLVPFQEVDEARVTVDHGGGKINDIVQYLVKWDLRGHSTGDAMQKNHVSAVSCYPMGQVSANQQRQPTVYRASARSIHAAHANQSAAVAQLSFGIESHEKK